MATLTWTTGTSGLWSTASNWSPAQSPVAGDSVFVTLPGAYLITLPASVQIGSMTLSDAQAAISTGGSLEIDGSLAIAAGTLQVTGTLNASGFSNTGTLVNNGSVTLNGTMSAASLEHVVGGGQLTVNGTVLNTGGTLDGTPLASQLLLNLGTIVGGTVSNVTGRLVSATLEGVSWQGPLVPLASLAVIDGLTLTGAGGTGSGTLTTTLGFPFQMGFINTQTFDSALVNGFGTFTAGSTLSLGTALTFDELINDSMVIQSFVFKGNTIFNHGTILGHSHEKSLPNTSD